MEWMRTKRHRTRLVAWTQRHSSCDADANPRTKATGGGARDALEPLDAFQAAPFRSAVGLIGYIVLDRPDCQYAAKAVRSATTEPTKLSWMRMMRLAKFLVAYNELGWLYPGAGCGGKVRGVRRFRLGELGNAKEHNRSIRTAWTASHRIQLLNSARCRSLKRRGRAVCHRTCGSRRVAVSTAAGRGWNVAEAGVLTDSTAPGREMTLDSGSRASWAILIEEGEYRQHR